MPQLIALIMEIPLMLKAGWFAWLLWAVAQVSWLRRARAVPRTPRKKIVYYWWPAGVSAAAAAAAIRAQTQTDACGPGPR